MSSLEGSESVVFGAWFFANRSHGASGYAAFAVAIVAIGCSGPAPPDPEGCGHGVIDTMEDGDDAICLDEGRTGDWYTFNDGTGTQTPPMFGSVLPARIPGGRGASHFAVHTFGDGCTGWGDALGVHLNAAPDGSVVPYDARRYSGLRFWTRGVGEAHFVVPELATAPVEDGGTCTQGCADSYGMAVDLGATWKQTTVAFRDLAQLGLGTWAPFLPSTILGIQFLIPCERSFDLWVDDVELY